MHSWMDPMDASGAFCSFQMYFKWRDYIIERERCQVNLLMTEGACVNLLMTEGACVNLLMTEGAFLS